MSLEVSPPGALRVRSLAALLSEPPMVREDVLGSWFKQRSLALLYAPSGVGKSFLAMSMALAIAGGGSLLPWKAPKPRKVLLVDGEMDMADLQERFAMLLERIPGLDADAARLHLDLLSRQDQVTGVAFPDIAEESGRAAILEQARAAQAEVVILDNLSTLASVEDENAAASFNAFIDLMLNLKAEGRAVLLVHHARKAGSGEGSYRGSQKLSVIFNVIMRLEHPGGVPATNGAEFVLHWEKLRSQRDEGTRTALRVRLEETRWAWEQSEDALLERIVAELKQHRHGSNRKLAEALGIPQTSMRRLRAKAIGQKLLTEEGWEHCLAQARELARLKQLEREPSEGDPGETPDF